LRVSRFQTGGLVLGVAGVLTVAACGSGGGTTSQNSAPAAVQKLHFPVLQDPKTWDPGSMDAEVDTELMQNVFSNLWRYDDKLSIVPDIATDVPTTTNGDISADGKTYTVHLKSGVKFSNGDPVTSKDVLYSWNRSAALRGPYASNLGGIAGYSAVRAAGKAFCAKGADPTACHTAVETHLANNDPTLQMSGLTAPDATTVKIGLSASCGWCVSAWSLQGSTGSIVDENVIKTNPYLWWKDPSTQVGSGAFKMSAYVPKQSVTFVQVPNWWGSPKPTLTEIDIDIKDPSTQSTNDAAWEQGTYDLIGYDGDSSQPIADILRYQKSDTFKSQILIQPKGRTTWLSFNIGYPSTGGPFVGESAGAKGLRKAFALAVDKTALATTVCHNLTCAPATGGLITKGLAGYLGDNADPLGKFDASTAKQLLQQYDSDGSKTANLKYSYNTGSPNDDVAAFLQAQWQTNLGIHVALDPHPDASQFISDRLGGKFVMSRDGWQFDYNHPQDWFDNLWGALATGANTSGYGDPQGDPQGTFDSTLATADTQPLSQALPAYQQLSKQLSDDIAYIPLYYSVGQFFIHSYVKGAGSNTQADFYWNEISILSH
jgi:oligopeptide transport system substrate-binding protein